MHPPPPSIPFPQHPPLSRCAKPHRCVVIIVLLCSYKRDPVRTRNGAAIFTQSREPPVEIFLCAPPSGGIGGTGVPGANNFGGSRFWIIQVGDRVVYRMMPNPLDENYAVCPNVEGCWNIADPKPGN